MQKKAFDGAGVGNHQPHGIQQGAEIAAVIEAVLEAGEELQAFLRVKLLDKAPRGRADRVVKTDSRLRRMILTLP